MSSEEAQLQLWTVADVIRETGLPKNRIYELVERREIPFVPIGSRFYFRPRSIEGWIAKLEQTPRRNPRYRVAARTMQGKKRPFAPQDRSGQPPSRGDTRRPPPTALTVRGTTLRSVP